MTPGADLARRARRTGPGLIAATFAVLGMAGLLSGCGGAHRSAPSPARAPVNTVPETAPGTLHVSPAHPTTRSSIAFRFTAPVASGVHGRDEIGYSLSVTGTGGRRCVGAQEADAPRVARGASAQIALGPARLGRPWCAGRYSARVIELQRAHCTGSAPCPQYIRVVAIVGRANFVVTRD